MTPAQKSQALIEAALGLGFDAALFAQAQPDPQSLARYDAWLAAGHQAGMNYLQRGAARRANPQSSLADTQSALVLLVAHAHATPAVPQNGVRAGRVARYAWSRDYHATLEPVLKKLESLATRLGVQSKSYCDHGPILERELGLRAGLGWLGRSSQLISTRFGAFASLAVLLTDLPSDTPDPLHPDRCGRCVACVAACPTDAILPTRNVDARKCIAYYTVEDPGVVPLGLRVRFGDHLFGCDDCLDVCPWSEHAGFFSGLLAPDPELAHPNLELFFELSNNQFEKRFAHSVFARSRRKTLARNACIVLGNLGVHAELLRVALRDQHWEVREAGAWALGRHATLEENANVLEAALHDPHATVRETAAQALRGAFL